MTREIEIEILEQSDVILLNIQKEKKRDVQKLIDELLSILSNYTSFSILLRDLISHEKFQSKSQSSFLLFSSSSALVCFKI